MHDHNLSETENSLSEIGPHILIQKLPKTIQEQIKEEYKKLNGNYSMEDMQLQYLFGCAIFNIENELENKLMATRIAPSHRRLKIVKQLNTIRNKLPQHYDNYSCGHKI